MYLAEVLELSAVQLEVTLVAPVGLLKQPHPDDRPAGMLLRLVVETEVT